MSSSHKQHGQHCSSARLSSCALTKGYDHPFLRLSHRDAFFTHFALINLVASPSIPTGRPESGYYLMTITTRLLRGVIGLTNKGARDIEAAQSALDQEERASEPNAATDEGFELEEKMDRPEYWWRPWDVTSRYVSVGGADEACESKRAEIRCVLTAAGEHFVMMDQYVAVAAPPAFVTRTDSCRIVTFTLFPSLITPYRALQRDLEAGQVAATMCSKALGSKSFVHKCAGLIEAELSCGLHWELPISTMVRFNDQGRSLAPPASFSPLWRVLTVRQGDSYSRHRHFQQCGRYLRPLCEAYPRDLTPRHRYRTR